MAARTQCLTSGRLCRRRYLAIRQGGGHRVKPELAGAAGQPHAEPDRSARAVGPDVAEAAIMQGRLENSVLTRTAPGSASVVQVESGRLVPWLMFCSVLSGLAVGLAFSPWCSANRANAKRVLRNT